MPSCLNCYFSFCSTAWKTSSIWNQQARSCLEGLSTYMGFPGGSAGKASACNAGDLGSIPGLGRCPGDGKGYTLQYSGLENPMDCIVHGVTKSQTRLSYFHFPYTCCAHMLSCSTSQIYMSVLSPPQGIILHSPWYCGYMGNGFNIFLQLIKEAKDDSCCWIPKNSSPPWKRTEKPHSLTRKAEESHENSHFLWKAFTYTSMLRTSLVIQW